MSLKSRLLGSKSSDSTVQLLECLDRLGLSPNHIIDIGANRGDWSRKALKVFPNAKVTSFEPQRSLSPYHADLAANPSVKIEYAGVGKVDGEATFTIHDRDDSSSFSYSEEQAQEKGYEQQEIRIHCLDTYLETASFGRPSIIKIDAEGLDLEVLEGAKRTLKETDVVLVEAAVANPLYQNTVLKVMQIMDDFNFTLFDITDLNRTPQNRVLWLVELVFVQKNGVLEKASAQYT